MGNGTGNGIDPNQTNGQANTTGQANGTDPNATNGNNPNATNGTDPNQTNGKDNGKDQTAKADAKADSKQDKPKNSNVNVRVENPGDNGPVVQDNSSTAAAAAGAEGGSPTPTAGSESSGTTSSPTSTSTDATGTANPTSGSSSGENLSASNGSSTSTEGGTSGLSPPPTANSPPATEGSAGNTSTSNAAGQGSTTSATNPAGATGTSSNGGSDPNGTANSASNGQATSGTTAPAPEKQIVISTPVSDPGSGGSGNAEVVTDAAAPTPPATLDVTMTVPAPTDPSATNSATATATSTQTEPTNVNASIRVLSPGDNGPVSQSNDSSATSAAGANGGTASALPEATSTQTNPTNVNVSVRVGSAGDDAPTTQVNNSTATATPVAPSAVESATTNLPSEGPNSYADVQNVAGIAQNLSECPEDAACTVTGTPETNGSPSSTSSAPDQSTATATQEAPTNVSVSIRVASPGTTGDATQLNKATADGATSVTSTTNPDNLAVAVVVPGNPNDVVIPDATTTWIWNWNWTTGTAPTAPDATPFSTPNWNWDWTVPSDSTVAQTETSTATAPAATPGHWTWTWIWTRGDGWQQTWTYDQVCSCTWSWVWTWNWPAPTPTTAPATASQDVPAPPSDPQFVQTNESSAAAAALTTFDGRQTATSTTDGDPGLAAQYQGITSTQDAVAIANANQVRPTNAGWVLAGRIATLSQLNAIAAAASAAAFDSSSQAIKQSQVGTADGAFHGVEATQVIVTTQSAEALTVVAQSDAANINKIWSPIPTNHAQMGAISQTNQAVAVTYAAVSSHTAQITEQSQIGGGADQTASALQAAVTTQANEASAQVGQATVKNRNIVKIPGNGIWNPPVTQSNKVSAGAISTSASEISQTIVQAESGDGIAWNERAQQTATVKQSGSASASAGQANRENLAGWNGVVASETPASPATSGTGAAVQRARSPVRSPVFPGPAPPGRVTAPNVATHAVRGTSATHVVWPRSISPAPAGGETTPQAATQSVPSVSTPTAADQFRHILQNLLGAIASALGLLGATGFAALLALFTLAAPGVRRLQAPAPALGRSADFARRERPG